MIEEKYKWLYSYTLPCTRLGDERMFNELLENGQVVQNLRGDFSRENVRKYFLTEHNQREIEGGHKKDLHHRLASYFHLAVPYNVIERTEKHLFCELHELGFPVGDRRIFAFRELELAAQRGVLDRDDDLVITHAGIIAETCKKEDIAMYSEQLKSLRDAVA